MRALPFIAPRALARPTLVAVATLASSTVLHAQLGSFNPRPGPQGTYAITNARIVPVSGPEIARGTVLIKGSKIEAVGANVAIPSGAQVLDASGLTVYPGMMDAGTSMGLSEIGQGANATVDVAEVGSFNPNAQAYYAINPHSAHIGVARVVGITSVVSRPTGGILSGQAALVNLAGSTVPEMSVVPRVALAMELPRSGFGGRRGGGGGEFAALAGAANTQDVQRLRQRQLDSLRQILKDAEAYGKSLDAYARDKTLPRPKHDVVLESMLPAVRGEEPVMMVADRAGDIRESVLFAEEMKLKPIIVGGRDAWMVAAFLKQHNVPVLLGGINDLPTREDDPYDVNWSAAGKLVAAGVRIAVTSGDAGSEVRNLPLVAGMAAAYGLSKADALKSVTLWPAQIMGVGDKMGSLDAGKVANLVVTDGDLLEAKTNTRYLFIDGRPVPLDSKHTELYTQFKQRP
ncbi:MAG: amidohydrolase family protein [Gemmatimonadetes bacterium]|nr:amidohydrolase family protein [Gemmatimonadota bacterium]